MLVPQGGLERFFKLDVQAGGRGETACNGYGTVCSSSWWWGYPYQYRCCWTDAKEAFVDTFAHEQKVTELINKLADVADEEKDRASQNFIAKYIDEQVEEEKNVKDILDSFAHLESHAIAHIDSKLEQAR